MLGRMEEPDTGMLCPQKRTSGTSCDTEGWICESMRPWDLSWQTSPRIWSVTRFVSKLTFWTWVSGWKRSELEGLKWDATLHPSLELWNTSCKIRFPCWSEVHILWPLSPTELLFLVPLPEPAGGPPRWTKPPWTWAGETRNVSDTLFLIVCRTQWDIFGRSFYAAKNYTRGTSLSRLVSGLVCICALRTTSWSSEPAGGVCADYSETLLRGGGHPEATTFPGGPWDMRLPETAAPWSTRGGRVGRPVSWGHRRETIHLLPAYPGPGRGGSSLSRDAQTSLSLVTSSSSGETPRHSQASRET